MAELASMNAEQRDKYEQSLIQYRDMKSVIETAVEEAVEEREIEIARKAIRKGLDNETIADLTELAIKQIEQLRNETKNDEWQS